MYYAMVFFIVHTYFADKCHQYSETPTDNRNHDLSIHRITELGLVRLLVVLQFGRLLRVLLRALNHLFVLGKSCCCLTVCVTVNANSAARYCS